MPIRMSMWWLRLRFAWQKGGSNTLQLWFFIKTICSNSTQRSVLELFAQFWNTFKEEKLTTLNFIWMMTRKFIGLARQPLMANCLSSVVPVQTTISENRWYHDPKHIDNELIKVSKVVGCGLKRIGDLTYDFYLGTCATYFFPDERILLCFSEAQKSTCER